MAKHNWLSGLPFFKPSVAKMKANGDVKGLVNALDTFDYRIYQAAEKALLELGDSAIEPLIDLLFAHNSTRRQQAANILARITNGRCIEPMIRLLKEGNVGLRQTAVSSLAKYKDPRAIEALCWALKDADGYVRLLAMHALETNADASAVAPLVKVAQDPQASVHVQTILRLVLDHAATTVSTGDLRQAAQLNDSYVLIFAQIDTSCGFRTYNVTSEDADFSQIKQMARQELIRRGVDA